MMPSPSALPRRSVRRALVALAIGLLAACGPGGMLRAPAAAPRERYAQGLQAAGLHRTALGRDWLDAGVRALRAPAAATLPLREVGAFAPGEPVAVAWRMAPRRGQRITVRIDAQADSGTRLFSELYELPPDSTAPPRLVASTDSLRTTYTLTADAADARYVLRLQPELLRAVRWTVTLESGPSLAFPVQGRDSRAVQSFWGAVRDGGARDHEGIDIFAPRGTPVLAGADGIARVSENRLGGHVVFVRDPTRGQSLYYAHLDRQAVADGQSVRLGDTVGFVGNSGNARTTAPHLHFGIYRRGEGAIDPLAFVDTRVSRPGTAPARATALAGAPVRSTGGALAVRTGPGARAASVREVARHTWLTVDAVGAGAAGAGTSAAWLRVRLPDRSTGYVPAGAVEGVERPIARERLATATIIRSRPTTDGVPLRVVAEALEAEVYGRFDGFTLVATADGARGWVADPR